MSESILTAREDVNRALEALVDDAIMDLTDAPSNEMPSTPETEVKYSSPEQMRIVSIAQIGMNLSITRRSLRGREDGTEKEYDDDIIA